MINFKQQNKEMEALNERISELETIFNNYQIKTDNRINELEKQLNKKPSNKTCMIREQLDITITKYKKSILVKSTGETNTTQRYKEVFKDLEGQWMKTNETCGWIYPGKCQDSELEKNSKFIIDKLNEMNIEFDVI